MKQVLSTDYCNLWYSYRDRKDLIMTRKEYLSSLINNCFNLIDYKGLLTCYIPYVFMNIYRRARNISSSVQEVQSKCPRI